MKKGFLRYFLLGIVVSTIFYGSIFYGVVSNQKKEIEASLEMGMKLSDIKWLAGEGKISEEEFINLKKTFSNSTTIEEANQCLSEILEGKEEEYLKEKEETMQKVKNILDN